MKGPAAATLYGTEAANGVIQIITKKGGQGKPTWDVTVRNGTNEFANQASRLFTNYGRPIWVSEAVRSSFAID